jgi:hypothetical protein
MTRWPMMASREGGTMAGERHGAMQTWAAYTLARVYAQGVADGTAAAAADGPDFLSYAVVLDTAWEKSCDRPNVQPLAEQEEYFVAWVHGYVRRADEIEDAPDTWEDPGKACPAPWLESPAEESRAPA